MVPFSPPWRVGTGSRVRGLGLAVALSLCACNEPSDACVGLAESDLKLTAYLTDDGKRARAEIEIRRPDDDANLALPLCEGSTIHVDGAPASRVRRPSGASVYKVDIALIASDAHKYTFTLRDDDFRADYTATVEAPDFAITAPEAGVSLSRAATWDIAWEPPRPGAMIRVRVDDVIDGEACLGAPVELELGDSGAAQVSPGQLKVDATGLPAVDKCSATLRLSRHAVAPLERVGGASRLHPDSSVLAAASRELPFISVP